MFNCCCGQNEETQQANFSPMAETTPYADYSGVSAKESPDFRRMDAPVSTGQDAPARTYSTEDQSDEPPPPPQQTASGASSNTASQHASRDRDKMEEKQKLQERVQSFAKRATRGVDCSLGKAETNDWKPATYLLGKGLKEFIVRQEGGPEQVIPISDIVDLLKVSDDPQVANHALTKTLNAEDQKRMFLVKCTNKEIFLLEKNVEEADIFCSSMRVLRLYCQQQATRK